MQLREMVRYRANLVRVRSIIKNRIHAHLLMCNIKIDCTPFTKEFIKTLRELNDYKINGYLNVLEVLNKEIDDISNRIKVIAKDSEDAKLLMSIPRISFYSALFILSEIGDINRFPDLEHLVSYAGLAPSTRSSGNKVYHGPKQGSSYLRWILTQVTWANVRKEPNGTVGNFYSKLKKKKGSAKAIVAASAKLLRIIYWVLKEHRPYQS